MTLQKPLMMLEITVLSAEGLKTSSSIFSKRIRPFITVTVDHRKDSQLVSFQSREDDEGGANPTWGDKFCLPLSSTFFTHHEHSSVCLQIYTKRLMAGKSHLGWCQIPAADVLEGFFPMGSVRHLSYRLRERDGTRGQGVVNVAVRILGQVPASGQTSTGNSLAGFPETKGSNTVIGIPATMLPAISDSLYNPSLSNSKLV